MPPRRQLRLDGVGKPGRAGGPQRGRELGEERGRVGRLAAALLGGGVLAHTFLIGMQTVQAGHAPLVGTSAAISAFVWLLGLSYLYVELTSDERSMGAFVAVLLVALDVIAALDPSVTPRPPLLRSPLFTIHVMSLLLAYASFALACVLGVTYVLLFKEIKAKHLGFFYTRLPSLQVLDVMNSRAITVGWIFLTLGVIVGGIWAVAIGATRIVLAFQLRNLPKEVDEAYAGRASDGAAGSSPEAGRFAPTGASSG